MNYREHEFESLGLGHLRIVRAVSVGRCRGCIDACNCFNARHDLQSLCLADTGVLCRSEINEWACIMTDHLVQRLSITRSVNVGVI